MRPYTRNIFRDPDIGDTIRVNGETLRVIETSHAAGTGDIKVHVRVNDDRAHCRTMFVRTWREYEDHAEVIVDGGKREGFTAG